MPGEMIMLVDDEADIGEIIEMYAVSDGFQFQQAMNGAEALRMVDAYSPEIIILDVFLPDIEGYELCRQLRAVTDAPIVFLTCKFTEMDKIIGLSVGGDDYMSKPFSPLELIARIKAHLRRTRMAMRRMEEPRKASILASESLQVNLSAHEAYLYSQRLELSAKEYQLLTFFMNHSGQVLTAEQLLDKLWGYGKGLGSKTLQVHIGNLRRKIEDDPARPERIVTIRGVGYKFCEHAAII
ncbi:response regulator transcription factor [Paenibacillus zanthoxyli]|uniref:response regulator transcription factor n=1 Tax=Paenibacillus zanthoxyli TaxID=369399 RepID=UPI000470B6F8|nr:response regulator transcription factor [Paenibacillus zanthoxyli]